MASLLRALNRLADDACNQRDAEGFIRLNGLRLKLRAWRDAKNR